MKISELGNAVTGDIPSQNFLVDVCQENTGGESSEISVPFNETIGVENDRFSQIRLRHLIEEGAAQFMFDFLLGKAKVQTRESKLHAAAKIDSVPKFARSVGPVEDDHLLLGGLVVFDELLLLEESVLGAMRSIENVRLGNFVVPLAYQFLLNNVLKILDANKFLAAPGDAVG